LERAPFRRTAALPQPPLLAIVALCDPDLDPLFWPAERLGAISAWWAHVPFAFWLTRFIRPHLFVELGAHSGVSYSAFCEAVVRERLDTRCFAIDTWRGDEHAGFYGDEVYDEFRSFHDERYSGFSTLLRSTFDDAVLKLGDSSVDLLHIDGLHTYEAVRHDFETWRPKLSDRAVMLLHDTSEREEDFGVWRLWSELKEQFPSFEFLHGHGLGILAVGRDVPPPIASLCAVTGPAMATIRERFAFAGQRWVVEMHERHVRGEIDAARREAAEMRKAARTEALARIDAEDRFETERLRSEEQAETLRHEVVALVAKIEAVRYEAAQAQAREALRRAKAEARVLELQSANARISAPLRLVRSLARKSVKIARVGWWTITLRLSGKLREQREFEQALAIVIESSLFDADWYRGQYADVAAAEIDPALHYVAHGAAEGRNPGPNFDGNRYLENYADVAAAGLNPLVHYLLFGQNEEREIRPVNSALRETGDPDDPKERGLHTQLPGSRIA